MQYVYCCEKCKAVGKTYKSSCPKCGWGKVQEVPFDGSFVVVQDSEMRAKLKAIYDRNYNNEMEF